MRTILVDNYDSYSYNLFQLMASTFSIEATVLLDDSPRWAHRSRRLRGGRHLTGTRTPGQASGPRGGARSSAGRLDPRSRCVSGASGAGLARRRADRLGTDLFRGLPQEFVAVRYHSLCLAEPLPPGVAATAWSQDGVIMGSRHEKKPWWGVQFHPESLATEHGVALLANFGEVVHEYRHRGRARVASECRSRGARAHGALC